MSAGGSGAIGPVSVRYAAQIRELLHVQAVQRMAADREAARAHAEAERAARVEAAAKAEEARQPLRAKVETPTPAPPARQPEPPAEPNTVAATEPARIVDIQA